MAAMFILACHEILADIISRLGLDEESIKDKRLLLPKLNPQNEDVIAVFKNTFKMDKSWMFKDRRSKDYENGVEQFLNFAMTHAIDLQSIRCPCRVCGNLRSQPIRVIRNHLFFNGIDQSYTTRIWHGETVTDRASPCLNEQDISQQQFDTSPINNVAEIIEMVQDAYDRCTTDSEVFKKLLEDAEKTLYPGCTKFTKLSALVKLYNFKITNGLSHTGFSDLLTLLGDMLPMNNEIPSSMYEAGKTFAALGMGYKKIHACSFDCILYRNEYKDATSCPTCGTSRWKLKKNSTEIRKDVPAKVLWFFPPIPRFQRMFQSAKIAKDLTWHAHERDSDTTMCHPADSPSWKLVDHKWPDFVAEPRNLRLAISVDGINPHSSLSSKYSCWPVMMITYNLPLWLCMKRKFMMLSLLISGPQQPGNDIDVYLAPLIDDLKMLWEIGVEAYDAYKEEHFRLKAILLWTINDFPALGNLSDCTVKGYYACPICSEGTCSHRLKYGKKNTYAGHIKFLPRYHPYRRQKKAFSGEQEFGLAPIPLRGEEILNKVEGLCILLEKFDFVDQFTLDGCTNLRGCIAESYIVEEAVEFCAEYLSGVDTIGIPFSRNITVDDDIEIGRPLSSCSVVTVHRNECEQAHHYVLENTSDIQPYIE
ncbi:uncharacterized protein LOC114267901 [Camellia sinensis]|uniref:uncharacterized protein LOC114267901 n=1 Tax=Camellia sinensis TaxID=4442 RepID=UPI0010359A80|nr:uncharacterized protein LOC114267901 [Camellia sinensis]